MQAAVAVAMSVLLGGNLIIHGYCMTMPDDCDTLPDAIDSMSSFCDHIYLVDGGLGAGTLCQHPRYIEPIKYWMDSGCGEHDEYHFVWDMKPLTLWENEFKNPGNQRNFILGKMLKEPEQPDWIVWLDSDEVFSNEFIRDVRPFLEGLSPDVSNVCPKWLTLIEDEHHYAPAHSNFLTHSRMHHPGIVTYAEQWHEHQHYVGSRVSWDRYVIHTRMLFRRRLFIQRGHAIVNEGAWADVTSYPVPIGVTWNLHWPEGEPIGVPYSADIRNYEGGKWATI